MNTVLKEKKFNELTEEELDLMSQEEIINKSLSEYVEEINLHVKDIKTCKQHVFGSLIIIALAVYFLSSAWPLLILLFTAFHAIGWFKLTKSIVWHVRSLKSTASMYLDCGYSYLVRKNIEKVDECVNIGEFY